MGFRIDNLAELGAAATEEAAKLLFDSFKDNAPSWLPSFRDAVRVTAWALTSTQKEPRLCRAAIDDDGAMLGWVACTKESSAAWELHPINVVRTARRSGVGKALVDDLENLIREKGARTLFLSTDDELGRTSLSNVDLLPDVLSHLANTNAEPAHPLGFYLRLGFTITGVTPDAEGLGNPTITLAKYV